MGKGVPCINLVKAIIGRLLLCACIFLTSWRAATVTNDNADQLTGPTQSDGSFDSNFLMTWLPCAGIILFIPEIIMTMIINHGHEFKWWWPSIAIFLACNIPNIWVIELELYERVDGNQSSVGWSVETLSKIQSFTIPMYFTPPNWARLLEQISFLVIVLAKWLSPKGLTSHERLSQLLLGFIGMASDILDLMDNLHDDMKQYSKTVVYVILFCYTMSHTQFSFNYTAKRKYKLRWSSDESDIMGSMKTRRRIKYIFCCCFESEMWVMITTIFSMDGMFFALRLYLFLGLRVVTFGNIFFATKNGMVVAIDIYRIISIASKMRRRAKESIDEQRRPHMEDDDDEDDDIDEDRIVDLHLIVESDGVVMASARTLRHENSAEKLLVRKKKSWELNAIVPQWANRQKRGKNQIVVPGAELHIVYELEFIFDHPGNDDTSDNRVFKTIKDIQIRDAINAPPKTAKNAVRPISGRSTTSHHSWHENVDQRL